MNRLFNPRTIAVVGASADTKSVGYGLFKNLVGGCVYKCKRCAAFTGKVYPINPNHKEILGIKTYPDISSVKGRIDLVIIAVPARIVPAIARQCALKRVGGVIIISAGFAEAGAEGAKLQDETVEALKGIPMIGPNCLGILIPQEHLNASFAPSMPPVGAVGFVSQSGALADSIIDWAIEERYGFSAIISYGNAAMLRVHDYLRYLDRDRKTKVITLYIEGLKDGRRFLETAKRIRKPIIAVKSGKTDEGMKAISSHTGSMAGSYEVYKAAFRQAGVIEAETVEEMFEMAKALAEQPVPKKNAIAIITNGGGCGVLCADYCNKLGVRLAELKKSTIAKLDRTGKMHHAYSRRNPLDIVGDALPERYEAALNVLLGEEYIHGVIVIQTMQTMTDPEKDAEVIIRAHRKFPKKPVICTYIGGRLIDKSVKMLEEHSIPNYNDTYKSALAMKALMTRIKRRV